MSKLKIVGVPYSEPMSSDKSTFGTHEQLVDRVPLWIGRARFQQPYPLLGGNPLEAFHSRILLHEVVDLLEADAVGRVYDVVERSLRTPVSDLEDLQDSTGCDVVRKVRRALCARRHDRMSTGQHQSFSRGRFPRDSRHADFYARLRRRGSGLTSLISGTAPRLWAVRSMSGMASVVFQTPL